jgi:MFS family permease
MMSRFTLRPPAIVGQTFAALRHPNYRLWFIGQLVSLVGTWMQTTAQGFLVYQLTGSAAYLGYVGFASGLPSWLFTLYGGVVADRIPRQRLLIITQSAMMILAFILAALVGLNLVQPWHIVVMALLLGIANSFDAPARVAFVAELVDRRDLTNAIALNAMMFNGGAIIGPAAAGVAYAALGAFWCFIFNGVSFLAVIGALLLMHIPVQSVPRAVTKTRAALVEGLQYVWRSPIIRTITLNIGIMAMFGTVLTTLAPAWAIEVLQGDVTTNGLLLTARGAGALLGALMIAALAGRRARSKLLFLGVFTLPIFILIFAAVRWLPLALLVLVGAGWAFMVQANTSNSLVQTQTPDALRGRVMSVYTMVFFGTVPIGSLLSGQIADRAGEPAAVYVAGAALAVFAVLLYVRSPHLRQLE